MEQTTKTPNLVASTRDIYCSSIAESKLHESKIQDVEIAEAESVAANDDTGDWIEANYFKSSQWTPDGTTLLTSSADDTIRTFILPPTLLDDPSSPITLTPYSKHKYPSPINCLAPYPLYDLSDPNTTLYLSTPSALPIRLTNTLSLTPAPLSTYPLISPTTEAYYTPSSLLWSKSNPSHFLAGTDCLIALFDISRNGEGPVARMPTIPSKRHKMKGGGVGMRGIVSAMSLQPSPENADSGMLAAGTWTRWVGLYDMAGMGGTVATWSIAEAASVSSGIGGAGVTQTLWSGCGKYLYVVERRSRGVLIYDVRVTGKLVSWLEGREAETNQRLSVDAFQAECGMEIWAGGTDGNVKVWEGVGLTEGALEKSWQWRTHEDPVTSTAVHSSGTVVATCSGQRAFAVLEEEDSDDSTGDEEESSDEDKPASNRFSNKDPKNPSGTLDNSIKVWSL